MTIWEQPKGSHRSALVAPLKGVEDLVKNGILTVGVGLGALASLNALISSTTQPLKSMLPGESRIYTWHGFRIFYKVLGQGEPLLLVHGIGGGASSYEFRSVLSELGQHYRTYAIDLLGWGNSDRPDLEYTGALYAELLRDFTREVITQPTYAIANSLAASFVLRAACQDPGYWPKVVLVAPLGNNRLTSETSPMADLLRDLAYGMLSLPVVGLSLYYGIVSPFTTRLFTEQSLFTPNYPDLDTISDYYYTSAHQAGAQFAPRSFLTGKLNLPIAADFEAFAGSMVLIWGDQNRLTSPQQAERYRQIRPEVTCEILPGAAFPHIESAELFNQIVLRFLGKGS